MGEPVPHGYQRNLQEKSVIHGGGTQPVSHVEDYGADVPFAEPLISTSKTTPSSSPLNSELDINNSPESDRGYAVNLGQAEANQKEINAEPKRSEVFDEEANPNIVGWDGPNDPANPLNWSGRAKWSNVMVVSMITFIT